jgi:subtilase family serine protease
VYRLDQVRLARHLAVVLFWTTVLIFSHAPDSRAQNPPVQRLRGHIPEAAKRLTSIGRENGSDRLKLAFGLPLRNQEELTNLLREIYDPTSPNYHHYLTPEEFTARFGPTEEDYQAVVQFAQRNGLNVTATHPNRLVLDVEASVADIERTLHVEMRRFQHPTEARTFHAPSVEPTLDLAVPILHISGLDNYQLPHPNSRLRPPLLEAQATPNAGSGPGGAFRGNDFRAAYSVGPLTGVGQTVGLLQFDSYYPADIAAYESQAGLPAVPLVNVAINGGVSTPGSGNNEVALDIEMVVSMAPGVSQIILYEAPNPSPWVDILSRMANDNIAKQIGCSWGGGGPDPSSEQIFLQFALQGQSFFNASGDSDAFTGLVPFPSDSTNITQVGGTTLTTTCLL